MKKDQSYEIVGQAKTPKNANTRSKGSKRIMRATDKSDLIEDLMSEDIGVFREIWRLLLFAAQIGIKKGRKEPLKSVDSGKGIDQATFGNSSAWPGILYLMSIAETGDASLLSGDNSGDDQRISLFEEYANGGLSELKEYFAVNALSLDSLLSFIEVNTLISKAGDNEINLSI
jgi:dnd system-associated protein 4